MPHAHTSQRSLAACSLWCRVRCCPRRRCPGCSRACPLASSGHGGKLRPHGPWSATASGTGCRTAWAANSRLVLSASCVPLTGSRLCHSSPARRPPAAGRRRQQVQNISAAAQASALCPHKPVATGRTRIKGAESRAHGQCTLRATWALRAPGSHCLQGLHSQPDCHHDAALADVSAMRDRGQVAADPA